MIRSTAIENLNYIYNILMKCSTSISNILKALWNPFFRTYLQKRLFQFDAMNKYIVFDVSLTCFRLRDLKWEVCGHATAHTRKIGFNQKSFLVKVMQHIEFFISFLTFHRPHTKPKNIYKYDTQCNGASFLPFDVLPLKLCWFRMYNNLSHYFSKSLNSKT